MKKTILVLIFILYETIAFSMGSLDVAISGGLNFDYIVAPDNGSSHSTIFADNNGVAVSFISYDLEDTVSVTLSGSNITDSKLVLDNGNITIKFISSTDSWDGISTDTPFYIGGIITVKEGATGNNEIDEDIIITVISESLD